jgi:tRNA A37 threonylcarbamoyladenosine dehydratase
VSAVGEPDRRFGGVARLYGAAAFARLAAARIAVVGVGGVGSWAAEALARSGVGALDLIDLDHIAESNINRQVHALADTLGQAKVQAMAARIGAIAPACQVTSIEDFVTPDNVAAILPAGDVVLDCIDAVQAKAALLAHCVAAGRRVFASGAGGGRTDPLRLRADDLALARGDPLLAKLRYRLRRKHGFAREADCRFGIVAVYSDEPVRPPAPGGGADSGAFASGLSCAGYGSAVTVTAALGFALAAAALNALARS